MKLIRVLNLLTLLLTITVNSLANILPINGLQTGAISDSFPLLFTPAGYVFAIWGVIYLALTVFGIYQILPSQRGNQRIDRIGPWFIIANLANAGWIFAWHYQLFPLSLALMLVLLVALLTIYLRLGIGAQRVSTSEKLLVNLPFSIYLGWISVATVANVSVVLYGLNWNGFGIDPVVWTVALIAVAALLGGLMIFLRREVAYPLVLVWALAGIWVKNGQAGTVALAALGAAVLVALLIVVSRLLPRKGTV